MDLSKTPLNTLVLELIKLKTHVFYEPNAILYEEKTEDYGAISNQRTRWLGGQIYLFRKNFFRLIGLGIKQVRIGTVDYAFNLFKIGNYTYDFFYRCWLMFF